MTRRNDNAPKTFREVPCTRCGNDFQSTGPNSKRCDPCKAEHKREYERVQQRARHIRNAACIRCGKAFGSDVHAHRKYCLPCGKAVHLDQTLVVANRLYHQKHKHNPGRRLHNSMAVLIRRGLVKGKGGVPWQSLVGYSLDDLRRHLERQFTKGMTWDNIGKWHVDHIQPRASFTFSDAADPEFLACWALTNLQPLWATDNLKKSDKRASLL